MTPIHKSGRATSVGGALSTALSTVWLTMHVIMLAGCQDLTNKTFEVPEDSQMLSKVSISPHGLTMAVGDIEQLRIGATSITGNSLPIDQADEIRWTMDTTRVQVTNANMLKAVGVTSGIAPTRIIGAWQYRGITKADTLYVRVTGTRPATSVTHANFELAAGDSAKSPISVQRALPTLRVFLSDNSFITDAFVFTYSTRRLALRAPDMVNAQQRTFTVLDRGPFWLYAEGRVYGMDVRDSVAWTGTDPITITRAVAQVELQNAPSVYPNAYLAPCGSVTISNLTTRYDSKFSGDTYPGVPLYVEWDDPSNVTPCVAGGESGHIGIIPIGQSATRAIANPGTVRLRIYENDVNGRLIHEETIVVR